MFGRMGLLEEHDGTVVGVFWPFPSGQSIEYNKCTLLDVAATPPQQTYLNEWLVIFYLMDVFHVVYK